MEQEKKKLITILVPAYNEQEVLHLLYDRLVKLMNENTGYDFEKDIQGKMMVMWPETRELLRYIDILVDGEFEMDKKDLSLRFRGSSNQRIINVKRSLAENKVCLEEEFYK